jgi:hypothetical protein
VVVLLAVSLAALFALSCVALLVRSVRQNGGESAGLDASHDAALEESKGDRAGTAGRDAADTETASLTRYHWNLFI